MDIVEKIASVVLPQVLSNPAEQESEANLLTQFITIFSSKIAGNDGEPTVDATADGVSIIQNIFPQAEERGELITKLSEIHNVDEAKTQGLLASAAPLVLGQLNSLSGGGSISSFLQDHLSILGDRLPSWATSILPAGLLGALGAVGAGVGKAGEKVLDTAGDVAGGAVDGVKNVAGGAAELAGDAVDGVKHAAGSAANTAANVAEDVAEAGGGLMKALLPIIGLILLGLLALFLWKACQPDGKAPAPAATTHEQPPAETAPAVSTTGEPATFSITTGTGDEVYACNGRVGDQSLKDKLIAAVKGVFAGSEACDNTVMVDGDYSNTLAGTDNIDEALAAIKAVPNASAQFENGQLTVDAPDQAALNGLVDKLKELLPELSVTAVAPLNIDDEVKRGVDGALAALGRLGPDATSAQIARALNLQVINFATGSSDIPAENKPVLDKAAEVINAASDITLGITGHTDSTGDASINLPLSQERAASVKNYLVDKGVAAEALTTTGVGSSMPVATNETENGRFRNRRIAFSADAVMADVVNGVKDAVAGTTDAVVSGTGDALGSVADATSDAIGAAIEGTGNAANSITKGMNEAAKATGDAIAQGADTAAVATNDAANDAAAALPDIDIMTE